MPLKTVVGGRLVVHLAVLAAVVAGVMLFVGVLDAAFAQQAGPFGAPRPPAAPPIGGVIGWILAKQAEFYKQFSGLIRAARTDGSAAWSLFGLAFLYGIFHAAGPGHGKAVISSYLVANDETWKRGVVLSFVSALVQALVAVAIVGVAAALLNATAATMKSAVNVIETVSYTLIILIGARLLWVKGRAFVKELRMLGRPTAVGAAVTPLRALHAHDNYDHGHHHDDHAYRDHERSHVARAHEHSGHGRHHDHDHHAHGHSHDRGEDASAWGHAHAPEPEELAGPGGWQRGFSAVIAVGLRPCAGAILVLVFALAQGLFWAGVVATFVMGIGTAITVAAIATLAVGARSWAGRFAHARAGYGMLAMRGIEAAAAVAILAFGALLLTGYMVSERMI